MKRITILVLSLFLFGPTNLQAQNWVNNGNMLTGNGTIGTNSNHSLLFETYNTERGRITNTGLWGIGTTAPISKFHINSATGQDALRVQVNGVTKLLAHQSGGLAVGLNNTPPANGLLVGGLVGLGTTAPNSRLHINSITNQDPLRVQINNSTKLLVHRGGGVSIGIANVPPANGLLVGGTVGIGTTTPSTTNKLEVVNTNHVWGSTGIYAEGGHYGLRAYGKWDEESGTGVDAIGGAIGISGYGYAAGVIGTAKEGSGVRGFSENGGTGVEGQGDEKGGYFRGSSGVEGHGYKVGGYFHAEGGDGLHASTDNPTQSWAGYFTGDIYSSGSYQGSDKNIKKNIQEMGNAMSIINKLKPSYYQYRDDGKYASLKLPPGNHYGLLAQDVEEVLPNLVKETSHEVREHKPMPKPGPDGKFDFAAIKQASKEPKEKITIKAVNYTELIPILIKGAQEQQATIEQLQQENITLKERLTKLEAALSSGKNGSTGGYIESNLEQNYPNPFKGTTVFNYSIPKGAKAQILVYDVSGKLVRTQPAPDSGLVQMDANGLSAGIYTYTLIVEGKRIASKHMLIEK